MARKPFANSPQFNGEILTNYIFGIQTGQNLASDSPSGLSQMMYITAEKLRAFMREGMASVYNYLGAYSSLPDNLAVGDAFYATASFGTFTQGHLYAYNSNSTWDDVTNIFTIYAKQSQVDAIDTRLTDAEDKIDAMGDGIIIKGYCTYAELQAIADPQVGWEYWVTDMNSFYLYSEDNGWMVVDSGVVQIPDITDTAHALSNAVVTQMNTDLKDAIQSEIGDIKTVETEVSYSTTKSQYGIRTTAVGGTISEYSTSGYSYRIYPVTVGDTIEVKTYKSSSSNYQYNGYFADENDAVISRFLEIGQYAELATETVKVPTGATKVYVNYASKTIGQYGDMYVKTVGIVDLQTQIDNLESIIDVEKHTADGIEENLLEGARVKVLELNKNNICMNFGFITDTHATKTNRATYNLDLFRKLANEKWCNFVAHGGDLVTVTSTTTQDDYFESIGIVLDRLGEIDVPVYISEGNHDVNGKNDDASVITPSQWYAMTRVMAQDVDFQISTQNSGYYYKDYDEYKIRVIVLDYYFGHSSQTGIENGGLGGEQMKWLATEGLWLADKDDYSDWSILILVHNVTTSNTNVPFWRAVHAFLNGQDLVESEYSAEYSQQGSGTVIAIVKGHEHSDTYTTVDGVNIIGTTCGYTSNTGAIASSDFAIDIYTINPTAQKINLTRMGRGSDREYTY